MVYYQCPNEDFKTHIGTFGFVEDFGTGSDISVIAPFLNVAAVNISCGFFNAHKSYEYVDLNVSERNIPRVIDIIDCPADRFNYY